MLAFDEKEKRVELSEETEVVELCLRIHGATEAGVGVGGEADRQFI